MNTILLPLAALLIAVLLIIIYFGKQNIKNNETILYSRMLVINLIYSILAIVIFIYAKTIGDVLVIAFLQKIYMISMLLLIMCMVLYNITIANFSSKNKKLFSKIMWVISIISSITILLTPLNVINVDDIIDGNGISYDITILITILYLIFIIISTIYIFVKNKDSFTKDIPFITLIALYIIGLVIRSYFPHIMFENFSSRLCY